MGATEGATRIPVLNARRTRRNLRMTSHQAAGGHVPSGGDCTRLPEAGLCSLTALEAALSRRDLEMKAQPGNLSPSPSPASDLYRAAVYEEFDAGNETGI